MRNLFIILLFGYVFVAGASAIARTCPVVEEFVFRCDGRECEPEFMKHFERYGNYCNRRSVMAEIGNGVMECLTLLYKNSPYAGQQGIFSASFSMSYYDYHPSLTLSQFNTNLSARNPFITGLCAQGEMIQPSESGTRLLSDYYEQHFRRLKEDVSLIKASYLAKVDDDYDQSMRWLALHWGGYLFWGGVICYSVTTFYIRFVHPNKPTFFGIKGALIIQFTIVVLGAFSIFNQPVGEGGALSIYAPLMIIILMMEHFLYRAKANRKT